MLLIIVLVLLFVGLPSGYYGYNRVEGGSYVHGGGFGIGAILLILLLLFLFGGGLGGFPHYRW
jgi:hypothetical protein